MLSTWAMSTGWQMFCEGKDLIDTIVQLKSDPQAF